MVMPAVGAAGCVTSSAGWLVTAAAATRPVMSATPAPHLLHILDAHAAGEQGNCQEETDQQHRDEHQHPGKRVQPSVTETLENRGSDRANG